MNGTHSPAFDAAIFFTAVFEKGDNQNAKTDLGRHTIHGVSSRSFPKDKYPEFWEKPTWENARDLIYRKYFWTPHRLRDLPDHYACLVMDSIVHSPERDAQKMFQRGLNWHGAGLKVDGDIGPRTRAAARRIQDATPRILAERQAFLLRMVQRRPAQRANWNGWMWRLNCLGLYVKGIQDGLPIHPLGHTMAGFEIDVRRVGDV